MGKKKRFGVAIDFLLAEKLDAIARSMNIDRSKLVEKAITDFVEEHNHNLEDHRCCGIIVVEAGECGAIDKVIEIYKDIIVSYTHNHIEKRCICMVLVLGNSRRIRGLHRELILVSNKTRYVPIAH